VSAHDFVSKELYDGLLIDEERHIDFLETQLELIKQLGVQLYSQRRMGKLEEES
jgi:bacterioferritin